MDLLDWLDWGSGAASPAADRSAAAARVTSLLRWCVHEGTPLFHGRHVDQIMLCAVYGVCKVASAAPTFRDVVAAYRRAPHARPDVFRAVPLDPLPTAGGAASAANPTPPRRTGDIIQFYNTVFVPAAREQLLALGAGAAPPAPPAPRAAAAARVAAGRRAAAAGRRVPHGARPHDGGARGAAPGVRRDAAARRRQRRRCQRRPRRRRRRRRPAPRRGGGRRVRAAGAGGGGGDVERGVMI